LPLGCCAPVSDEKVPLTLPALRISNVSDTAGSKAGAFTIASVPFKVALPPTDRRSN
jgi:hypothetical protein